MPGVLARRGDWDTDKCKGKVTQRCRWKTAVCELRREASKENKAANTLNSDF